MSYSIRAFADLAGVTAKALHHYERRGLLAPRRSRAGYRRYTVRDLACLDRILALKSLGLSPKQIATVAEGAEGVRHRGRRATVSDTTTIGDILRAHREHLIEKRHRLDEALTALDAITRDDEPATALRRFVGDASWARWEAKREKAAPTAPRAPDRVSASRLTLFQEISTALDRDPSGESARPLVARWDALLDAETGGDVATSAAMRNAWANRGNWPDGMRRYVASLYEAEADEWERVAAFVTRRP